MNSVYLIVFHAFLSKEGELEDIGEDPYFGEVPSWGICRPQVRKYIKNGDTLVFLGYLGNDEYILKGWFEVGEKISYPEALNRFPGRKNIIISYAYLERDTKWRYSPRKKLTEDHGVAPQKFLLNIDDTYFQNHLDDHEIDNWKCSRIFICNKNQFEKCVLVNLCHKNKDIENFEYRNYIIADPSKWEDTSVLKIKWEEIKAELNFSKTLRTKYNQHNVLTMTQSEKEILLKFIEKRKNRD